MKIFELSKQQIKNYNTSIDLNKGINDIITFQQILELFNYNQEQTEEMTLNILDTLIFYLLSGKIAVKPELPNSCEVCIERIQQLIPHNIVYQFLIDQLAKFNIAFQKYVSKQLEFKTVYSDNFDSVLSIIALLLTVIEYTNSKLEQNQQHIIMKIFEQINAYIIYVQELQETQNLFNNCQEFVTMTSKSCKILRHCIHILTQFKQDDRYSNCIQQNQYQLKKLNKPVFSGFTQYDGGYSQQVLKPIEVITYQSDEDKYNESYISQEPDLDQQSKKQIEQLQLKQQNNLKCNIDEVQQLISIIKSQQSGEQQQAFDPDDMDMSNEMEDSQDSFYYSTDVSSISSDTNHLEILDQQYKTQMLYRVYTDLSCDQFKYIENRLLNLLNYCIDNLDINFITNKQEIKDQIYKRLQKNLPIDAQYIILSHVSCNDTIECVQVQVLVQAIEIQKTLTSLAQILINCIQLNESNIQVDKQSQAEQKQLTLLKKQQIRLQTLKNTLDFMSTLFQFLKDNDYITYLLLTDIMYSNQLLLPFTVLLSTDITNFVQIQEHRLKSQQLCMFVKQNDESDIRNQLLFFCNDNIGKEKTFKLEAQLSSQIQAIIYLTIKNANLLTTQKYQQLQFQKLYILSSINVCNIKTIQKIDIKPTFQEKIYQLTQIQHLDDIKLDKLKNFTYSYPESHISWFQVIRVPNRQIVEESIKLIQQMFNATGYICQQYLNKIPSDDIKHKCKNVYFFNLNEFMIQPMQYYNEDGYRLNIVTFDCVQGELISLINCIYELYKMYKSEYIINYLEQRLSDVRQEDYVLAVEQFIAYD